MKRKILFAVITSAFCFQFCSQTQESVPREFIQPDSMVAVLIDIHIAEAASNVTRINDVQKFSAYDLYPIIFRTHHTDSVAFRKSFDYYLQHPKKLDKIYEQVLNELSRRESETDSK